MVKEEVKDGEERGRRGVLGGGEEEGAEQVGARLMQDLLAIPAAGGTHVSARGGRTLMCGDVYDNI